ncbi:hypothetical protein FSARC_12517 [Fusarium sarcochroum]|uniref:Uncharacterized protein n=1 Tax=Fusarium sarcochroum TaxID=1208366 RepID=A0A8H4T7W6_9HYPO|nr:hypothetical protein FSARC_12517 [Fusarium sarcochroum]
MSILDPDLFYNWEERANFLSNDEFVDSTVEFIEVINFENEPSRVLKKVFQPAEFRAWAAEPTNESTNSVTSGSDLVGMDASMSMSHSVSEKSTDVLLLCRHWCQASYLSDMIQRLAPVASHPVAMPIMLCSLYENTLHRQINSTWKLVFDVERASGQTGIDLMDPSGAIQPTGSCDDPELSRKAISGTQLAIAWATYVPRGIAMVAAVDSFLERYAESHVQHDDEHLIKQGRLLREHLTLVSQRADSSYHSAKHLLERSRIQVEALKYEVNRDSNNDFPPGYLHRGIVRDSGSKLGQSIPSTLLGHQHTSDSHCRRNMGWLDFTKDEKAWRHNV